MVFNTEKGKHVENSVGAADEFQIKADEKLFMLLSDSVYSDKIAAGIREITCNAYDAHVESNQTRKFQVTIPSEANPEFRVRDFGTGLAPEQMSMYTTYGDSTKEGSNAYIGAFGIGAKSPFAYTNTFNVTSYYGGKAYYYVMFVENGKPHKTLLSSCDTDEPSGLEVFYAVKPSDVDEFQSKAKRIIRWMKDRVEVLNADSWWLSDLENLNSDWQAADYLGQSFGEIGLEVNDNSYGGEFRVVQGNVLYSISQDECREAFSAFIDKEESGSFKVRQVMTPNVTFVGTLKVPNGTFMPQPSRERLSFTPETKEKLGSILCLIYREKVVTEISRMLKAAHNSYVRLYRLWTGAPSVVKNSPKFDNLYFKGYTSHVDFKAWTKSIVHNVRVMKIAATSRQASVVNIKETTAASIVQDQFPVYAYFSGAFLSFEKKCRILEDLKVLHAGPVAYIVFNDTTAFLSEEDLKAVKNVDDLPKSSAGIQAQWKLNAVSSGSALTVLNLRSGEVRRTSKVFSNPDDPTDDELDYTFWIPAEKAYKVEFANIKYDFEYKRGRMDFTDRYRTVVANYMAKTAEENQRSFYGDARLVLLPEGHPYRNLICEFKDIIVDGAKYYIDSYEAKLEYNLSYSDEYYLPFVKKLFERGLFNKVIDDASVIAKYNDWANKQYKTGRRLNSFCDLSFIPLDAAYTAKAQSLSQSSSSGIYSLEICEEVIKPVMEKFPLTQILYESYSSRKDPVVLNDLAEYVEYKLNIAENSEEKSA
jgi:hypothetical protein